MRIAIAQRLTLAHGIRGGMEQQAQQLAAGLQARGHEVLILTSPHPDGLVEAVEDDIAVRYISPGSWRRYTRRWWAACLNELTRLHTQQPFDLLASQSGGALGYVPQAATRLGLPIVTIIHGTLRGAVRTQWRSARSLRGAYRLGRLMLTLPYHFWLWKRSVPYVARWIAVSQLVADEWRTELGIDPGRIVAIPNGVDTQRFKPDSVARDTMRARLGISSQTRLLLAVGRLEYEKGLHLAIEALHMVQQSIPSVKLLIAGDGIERGNLEALVAATGGAARLLGHISQGELPGLLAASDLFLMPTLRDEAFPMTVAEALAVGVPVIASAVGGLPDAIDNGRTGCLVPLGDAAALARATIATLSDEARRTAMARAAREAAVKRFSHAQMVDATEKVLIDAMADRRPTWASNIHTPD